MKRLTKYKLNFDLAWKFTQSTLDQANALSCEVLNLIAPSKGSFFTLLPSNAVLERPYEFAYGGIILQNLEKDNRLSEKKTTYSVVSTIRDELSELILKKIKQQYGLSCIFDDVLRSPADKHHMDLFHTHGLYYKDEVYYLLEQSTISKKIVIECLRASNACWHSLCVLTNTPFDKSITRELTLRDIQNICLSADLVMIGAYDGEGYIFWEPGA